MHAVEAVLVSLLRRLTPPQRRSATYARPARRILTRLEHHLDRTNRRRKGPDTTRMTHLH